MSRSMYNNLLFISSSLFNLYSLFKYLKNIINIYFIIS